MLIVGEDLIDLIKKNDICSENLYDVTCITLELDEEIIKYKAGELLEYGKEIPKEWIISEKMDKNGIVLKPYECFLGCSNQKINMPNGYFGLLQTKGSLARLFVQIQCSDGQIDPGFRGKVTFEIINLSNCMIKLHKDQAVGNLYIFKTSNDKINDYLGKYCNSNKPTFYRK